MRVGQRMNEDRLKSLYFSQINGCQILATPVEFPKNDWEVVAVRR